MLVQMLTDLAQYCYHNHISQQSSHVAIYKLVHQNRTMYLEHKYFSVPLCHKLVLHMDQVLHQKYHLEDQL
uniref:CSON000995 protein n=1 Tax=Culicoides sonorensis TaxID=179676 RepID=A0A336MTA0_CULSO